MPQKHMTWFSSPAYFQRSNLFFFGRLHLRETGQCSTVSWIKQLLLAWHCARKQRCRFPHLHKKDNQFLFARLCDMVRNVHYLWRWAAVVFQQSLTVQSWQYWYLYLKCNLLKFNVLWPKYFLIWLMSVVQTKREIRWVNSSVTLKKKKKDDQHYKIKSHVLCYNIDIMRNLSKVL